MPDPLSSIISLITERASHDTNWLIRTDELESFINPVSLYRAVYETRLVERDAFGPDSVGELLTLLEALGFSHGEKRLREAGLFLNHSDRVELTERFVRGIRTAIVVHVPEPEIFKAMVREFRRYDVAQRTYCETYLPLEPVVDRCAAVVAEDHGGSRVFHGTARFYLESLLARRIVVLEDLAPAMFELLRSIARQEGFLPPIDDTARTRSERARSPERAAAETLGLSRGFGRRELQSRYRALMRTYHPDINPRGLEMAKRINAAYAILITDAVSR